jgi:cytochrome c oxidase cbb3-type subunit 3
MPGALPAGVVSDAAPGASESLLALSSDEATLAAGADVFRTTCAACHGAVGEGRVGPALTDSTWIHGSDPAAILRGVREGYVARGMPAWEPILGAERTRQAAAFVVSLARSAPEPAATAAPRD